MSLEDAAALRKQAGEIEMQNRVSVIGQTLRKNPLLIPVVEKALNEAGIDVSSLELLPEPGPASKKSKTSDAAVGKGSHLPKCEVYFGMLSSNTLQALLCELEACYTPESLSRLRPSARRAVPKASLLNLIEYLTGLKHDSWIGTTGPLKSFDYLAEALGRLNVLRGRRGRDVRLPPDWASDGVYRVFVSPEGRVGIQHKFLEKHSMASLPDQQLRIVRFPASLLIEKNWSETDALLVEVKGKLRFRIASLFADLVSENVLHSIGEYPENNVEALPRPFLEAGMAELMEGDRFVGRPALENGLARAWSASTIADAGESPGSKSSRAVTEAEKAPTDMEDLATEAGVPGKDGEDADADGPEALPEEDQQQEEAAPAADGDIVDESKLALS